MNANKIKTTLITLCLLWSCNLKLSAQTQESEIVQTDIVSILVMPYSYDNISATTARSIAEQMTSIINSHNLLQAWNTSSIINNLERIDPQLVDCYKISCALQITKLYDTDYILLSSIIYSNQEYQLEFQLIDNESQNIITTYNQKSISSNLDNIFLGLIQQILNHIPRWASVISADDDRVLLRYNKDNILDIGDQFIVYQAVETINTEEVENSVIESFPVAIVEVDSIQANIISGRILFYAEIPEANSRAVTYGNKNIQLAETRQARKRIDNYRTKIKIITAETAISSEIVDENLIDYDKIEWINEVRAAEKQREIYRWTTIGIGALLAGLLISDTKDIVYYGLGLAAGGYSLYKFQLARTNWQNLVDEGKFKGYLDPQWIPTSVIPPTTNNQKNKILFSYNINF